MLSLMALLDRKRTSDLKLLRHFDYPSDLSRLIFEHDLLQGFKECGEENLSPLKEVRFDVPVEYVEYFKAAKTNENDECLNG
ncbi:hypothetical protein RB195_003796 [Necator americanus]|uniref:Uncharacterized protein n=1 Tax=Necator americanus TaxID=51031 RepID=A0ABR1DQA3_NECAM